MVCVTCQRIICRRRMDEVRQMEHRATVEDLMYAAVLEKFLSLGVDMLGNMDNIMEKVTVSRRPVQAHLAATLFAPVAQGAVYCTKTQVFLACGNCRVATCGERVLVLNSQGSMCD